MTSKFQPIDLSKKCRIYFLFSPIGGKRFACYYDRPKWITEQVLYTEACTHAQTMKHLFGAEKLTRIFIARTQRQIERVERIL